MQSETLEIRVLSSLEKVFADEELRAAPWSRGSMLSNEAYSFQVSYKWSGPMKWNTKVRVNSDLLPWITIREVGLVPSEMPCYWDHDENVLRTTPGLYPDILLPIKQNTPQRLFQRWMELINKYSDGKPTL